MKQKLILILVLFITSIVCVNAQVTIGSQDQPHAGAILELKSNSLGLLLPRVALLGESIWTLEGNDPVEGMTVFNVGAALDKGVYVWLDGKWLSVSSEVVTDTNLPGMQNDWVTTNPEENEGNGSFSSPFVNACPATTVALIAKSGYELGAVEPASAASSFGGVLTFTNSGVVVVTKGDQVGMVYVTINSCSVPVEKIFITGETSVMAGSTIPLSTSVLPNNATNKAVRWYVTSGAAYASVDAISGEVRGLAEGTAIIVAMAQDGSGVTSEPYMVTVSSDGSVDMFIGNNKYKTYTYPWGDTWMVTNSKEGTPTAKMYNNDLNLENGYYYTIGQAVGACPSGWHVPTQTEWTTLSTWVNANTEHSAAKWWVLDGYGAFAGYYFGASNEWIGWAKYGYWWSASGSTNGFFRGDSSGLFGGGGGMGSGSSVRCVQDAVVVPVAGINLSPAKATLVATGTPDQKLDVTVLPLNATNQTVIWSSSDTDVATVDANGIVKAGANGQATITATTEDGSYTTTSEINVNHNAAGASWIVIPNAVYKPKNDPDQITVSGGGLTYSDAYNYYTVANRTLYSIHIPAANQTKNFAETYCSYLGNGLRLPNAAEASFLFEKLGYDHHSFFTSTKEASTGSYLVMSQSTKGVLAPATKADAIVCVAGQPDSRYE